MLWKIYQLLVYFNKWFFKQGFNIFETAHQVDIRLRQAISAPSHFRASYQQNRKNLGVSRAHYIRWFLAHTADSSRILIQAYFSFYNTVWLIANDVIIGSALLTLLCDNANYLAEQVSDLLKVRRCKDTLECAELVNSFILLDNCSIPYSGWMTGLEDSSSITNSANSSAMLSSGSQRSGRMVSRFAL